MRNRSLIRVLAILRRLEGGERVTLARLAEEHGVHQRTIRRDLAALEAAGVPLGHVPETEEGEGRFWWMVRL